jgi:hypothetical protein
MDDQSTVVTERLAGAAAEMATGAPQALRNPYGHMIPLHRIKPATLLEDQTVRDIAAKAFAMQVQLKALKVEMNEAVAAFMQLLHEQYGEHRGGRRGGVKLASFDGTLSVQVSVADLVEFGPELQVAKQLIDNCIGRWVVGANDNLSALVNDAFATGETGRVNTDRVLSLRRLKIDDPEWLKAMDAISDAVRVQRSKSYIRSYTREHPEADQVQLVLDISKL